jgi:spermidine/putrescine-binding protein
LNERLPTLFVAILLSLIAGCSNNEPSDTGKTPSSSEDTLAGGELRIVIRWGGDDLASKQDLEMRARIEGLIEERGVGQVTRSSTGMGWMDIWIKVKDKHEARGAVDAIMKEIAPHAKFSIETF